MYVGSNKLLQPGLQELMVAPGIENKNQRLFLSYKPFFEEISYKFDCKALFPVVKIYSSLVRSELKQVGGGHWVLRFCGFGYFRFLCQKTSVFRFWCSLRFAGFSFFNIWFSVFVKNTSGFSVLLSDVLFGFFYFVLFGFRFFLDLSGN